MYIYVCEKEVLFQRSGYFHVFYKLEYIRVITYKRKYIHTISFLR